MLIAEDDDLIRQGLVAILRDEGYETIEARTGLDALRAYQKQAPDFVCLDIMMPGMSGYDVCREIRRKSSLIPVIFISAKGQEVDKVVGLEIGADDFIVKPFGVKEVVARVRAVTRRYLAGRAAAASPRDFRLGDLEVSPSQLRARRGDEVIDLSLRDVRILELFERNPGRVLDRDTLIDHGWGERFEPSSRVLDQHIAQLRKRIEIDPKAPRIIQTVHGVGYRSDG